MLLENLPSVSRGRGSPISVGSEKHPSKLNESGSTIGPIESGTVGSGVAVAAWLVLAHVDFDGILDEGSLVRNDESVPDTTAGVGESLQ